MRGKRPAAARLRDRAKHFALISQRAGPLTASPEGEAQTVEKGVLTPWPPLRGGSARRRWGRELYGCPKYFGLWQGSLPPPLRGTSLAEGGFSTVCDFFALRTKKSPTVRSIERWGQNAISRPLKRRRAKRQNGGAACYWQEPHRRGKQPVDGSRLVMVSRR